MTRSVLVLSAAALAIAAPGCALDPDALHTDHQARPIIDGDPVTGDDFPTVGAVLTNIGSICTGTLIAPTVVLTAAHCVEPMLLKQSAGGNAPDEIVYQFTFARDLRGADPSELLAVESVVWHPEFLADIEAVLTPGVSQWNDIALVHLAEPITDRPVQRLAPADVMDGLVGEERMVAVAGYGLTSNEDDTSAGVLTAGQSGLDQFGEFEILAGEGDVQQACRGDSGGPIFADDGDTYQIGIASRINANLFPPPSEPPPCETGLLYTRVDTYAAWVEENSEVDLTDPDDGDEGDGDADEDGDGADDGDDGGCAASGGATGNAGLALLLALVAGGLRRRRRA